MDYNKIYSNELYHHGIKGQKWGVRRYQNKDGSLKTAGKKRYTKEEKKAIAKKVLAGALLASSVASAAYYVHKNPEKLKNVISKVKNINVKDLSKKAISKGKEYMSQMWKNTKEGFKEGFINEGPKKAAKVIGAGIILTAAKKGLDKSVGKEKSAKIFQANDNKKIGKFWKVSSEDKDEKED